MGQRRRPSSSRISRSPWTSFCWILSASRTNGDTEEPPQLQGRVNLPVSTLTTSSQCQVFPSSWQHLPDRAGGIASCLPSQIPGEAAQVTVQGSDEEERLLSWEGESPELLVLPSLQCRSSSVQPPPLPGLRVPRTRACRRRMP